MGSRLWVTLVDPATAKRAVKQASDLCFFIGGLFGVMPVQGIWRHEPDNAGLAMIAVFYLFFGWRVRRGSAMVLELSFILLFPAGDYVWTHPHAVPSFFGGALPLLFGVYSVMGLLNGLRAASYLEATGWAGPAYGDEPGSAGVPVGRGPRAGRPSVVDSGD